MRRLKIVILLIALASGVSAQTPAREARLCNFIEMGLRYFEGLRVAAIIKGDCEALDHVLSDDLIYIHSSGAIDTKAGLSTPSNPEFSSTRRWTIWKSRFARSTTPGLY